MVRFKTKSNVIAQHIINAYNLFIIPPLGVGVEIIVFDTRENIYI